MALYAWKTTGKLWYAAPSVCAVNHGKALWSSIPVCFKRNAHDHMESVTENKKTKDVKGLVYLSTSTDVFANLALEDWIYNNTDLTHTSLMILWRNDPCVVVGRHQNPWAEVNLRQLWNSGVKLARRRSGGGTVYQDLGNLNITFFTARERYDRPWNLKLISRAIKKSWPHLSVSITERDDIVMDEFFKIYISGTSSKLGRKIAYHHCTLLHSVNTHRLKELLEGKEERLNSKATPSIRSAVRNLADIEPAICHNSLVKCITNEYYSRFTPYKKSEHYKVDPTDVSIWKGIPKLHAELTSWDWVYGKTPRFSVTEKRGAITIVVHVHNAAIEGVVIQAPDGWIGIEEAHLFTECMKGQRFWSESVADAASAFVASSPDLCPELARKYRLLSSMIRDAAS